MRQHQNMILRLVAALILGSLFSLSPLLALDSELDPSCVDKSETKFALVIGNSYDGTRAVTGRKDAEVMAQHLCQLDYSITLLLDATLDELEGDPEDPDDDGELWRFRQKITDAKNVVLFYSGHGFQYAGENYLLPNDQVVNTRSPQVPLSHFLNALMGARNASKIIFLDACRTLVGRPGRLGLTRPQGLPRKSLIAFSAGYNQVAPSGKDEDESGDGHSPYSEELLESIREPGLELREFLERVDEGVSARQASAVELTPDFPAEFFFKKAIRLPMTVSEVDDQLFVFLEDRLAFVASDELDAFVDLRGGKHHLSLMLANAKTFQSGQNWQPPSPWSYQLDVQWPGDHEVDCQDFSPCFRGGEEVPFKAGPHHGAAFVVAEAEITVDPATWKITAEVDPHAWNTDPPRWARNQGELWSQSFAEIDFDRSPRVRRFVEAIGFVKTLLESLGISETVAFPKPETLHAKVFGNTALQVAATFCMKDRIEDRMTALESSLENLFENASDRPFDPFDQDIADCIQERVRQEPEHPFFGEEVIKVHTALQVHEPRTDPQS